MKLTLLFKYLVLFPTGQYDTELPEMRGCI